MSDIVVVGIAEANIVFHDKVLVTYALGSCVGVCLYEKNIKIAGMIHVLLPSFHTFHQITDIYKYADSGIPQLVKRMEMYGAKRKNLVAKIAGEAEMFCTEETKTGIGKRNIIAVKDTLNKLEIPIIAEHVGSNYGRSIWFSCKDGSLKVKTVNNGVQII